MYAGSTRDLREIAREMRRREFFWGISRNPPKQRFALARTRLQDQVSLTWRAPRTALSI